MGTGYRPEKIFLVPVAAEYQPTKKLGTDEYRVTARKKFLGTGLSEEKHFGYRWVQVPARKIFEDRLVPVLFLEIC